MFVTSKPYRNLVWVLLLFAGCTPTAAPTPTVTAVLPTFATIAPAVLNTASGPTRTPLPTLTPRAELATTLVSTVITAASVFTSATTATTARATLRPAPSATSALLALASATIDPNLTPTITPTVISVQPGEAPPFQITIPSGWNRTYTLIPISDLAGTGTMNLAAYAGPVAGGGGTGFIFALWNFPTVLPISPRALPTSVKDAQEQASLSDGYRLLRGSILDVSCAVNIYGRNYFPVGGKSGIGQIFQTAGCQDNRPDLIGWYSGLWEGGRHFLFFSYVEPPAAYNSAQADLQLILNTIQFTGINPPTPALPTITPGNVSATPLIAATPAPVTPIQTPTATAELN